MSPTGNDPLRAALVGAGQMGALHARVLSESRSTTLETIVDPEDAGQELARIWHARRLSSVDDLLADPPELAVVAVPTDRHATVAIPLLHAGVPVLLEKPIAGTTADAEAIIEAAGVHGTPLAIGHVERFNPAIRALRRHLAEQALGRVFQLRSERLSPFPVRVGDTGVALDLATHELDLMCILAGEPIRASAEIDRRAHRSYEDLIAATLRFDSGVIGVLEVNWLTPAKVRRLTVTGERGMFVVDYLDQHLTLYENAQELESWRTLDIFSGVTEGNVVRFAIPREEPLRAQLESFVTAVRGGAPVEVSGDAGLRALRLALALVDAGTLGRTVDLTSALAAPPRR